MNKLLSSCILFTCVAFLFSSCNSPVDEDNTPQPLNKYCLFVSTVGDTGAPGDVPMINKLRSWGCSLKVVGETELSMEADSFGNYDFAFLSETPNSSNFRPFRGHPLPILSLESYACSKPEVLNWSTHPGAVAKYDTMKVRIAANAPVELTGGLKPGEEFDLVTATASPGEALIGFIPTIQHIPIAVLTVDTLVSTLVERQGVDSSAITFTGGLLTAACAVEKGTTLADELTVTEARAVTIGIHEYAFESVTDEAYAMIRAGIEWILK